MAVDIQVKVNVQENDAIEKLERIRAASEGLESKDITININTTGLDNITTKSVKAVNAYASLVRAAVKYNDVQQKQEKLDVQRIRAQAADKSADARIMKEKRLTEANGKLAESTKTLVEEEEKAIKQKGLLERALGKPFGEYLLNRAAYMAVTESIRAVTNAFKEALGTMKEVDSELASIKKVTDFSGEQMAVIEKGAYSVASKYGVSAQDYLESVSAFAKAGYKELADDLGELAIKTQLVGDVNASTANKFLLAVDAAWKMEGSVTDLSRILDEANVVENNYATSIDKIAQGLPNVASAASMVGMSAEETIAALGTITAVTQQSGIKAATALRALLLNIMKDTTTEVEEGVTVTKEQISTLDEVLQVYAKDALDAAKATGEIVNPMKVVESLYEAYKDNRITKSDLAKIETALGGKLRTVQLEALIKNFDKYREMLDKITESAGSADKEIDIMLDTWEAKTNILKNTWTEFVAKTLSTNMFKGFLDTITKIVSAVGDLGTVFKALGGILAAKAIYNLPNIMSKISTALEPLAESIGNFLKLDITSDEYWSGAKPKIGGNLALAGATVLITAAIIAVQKYRQAIKEAAETSLEQAKASSDETDNIIKLSNAYEQAKASSQGVEQASKNLANALGIEGDAIQELVGQYDELIAKRLQNSFDEADEARTKSIRAVQDEFFWGSNGKYSINAQMYSAGNSQVGEAMRKALEPFQQVMSGGIFYSANSESYEDIVAYYNALGQALTNAHDAMRELNMEEDERTRVMNSPFFQHIERAYDGLSESITRAKDAYKVYAEEEAKTEFYNKKYEGLLSTKEQYEDLREEIIKTVKDEETQAVKLDVLKRMFPQFSGYVEETTAALAEQEQQANATANALERYKNALKGDGSGGLANKDDNWKTMTDAYDAMMKAGKKGMFGSTEFLAGKDLLLGEYGKGMSGKDAYKYLQGMKDFFSGDSMGRGLKNLIEAADAAGKLGEGLKDAVTITENGNGTFNFEITDNPEKLLDLADALGVSAEAIVFAQQAMGNFDETIDVGKLQGLLDAIQEARKLREEGGEGGESNAINVPVTTEGAEEAKADIDETKAKAEELNSQEPEVTVTANTSDAMTKLAAVAQRVNGLPSEKTITIKVVTEGGFPEFAEGTSNFKGGLAYVNDQKGGFNPELIEAGGKSFFVNNGKPSLVSLPKGAIVHSATETRKMFSGSITEIPHFDKGNNIPDLAKRSGKVAGIGSGKSSAGSKDWWEKLQQYMEDLLEKAGDALDKQLEAIDAELFYLQYGKEVSEKATKLEEARMDLLEAEQELINAQTERTVRYFNAETGQWEWMADQKDILKAQEDLAERQKDYLKAQYDYLEDVWKDLKDDIQKAIDGKKDVNIANVLKQMLKSKAGGLTGNVEGVIGDLLSLITAYESGTALDSYDSGGIASGLGYMLKATKADEVVLNGNLSSAILSPKRSQQFADFTNSLSRLFNMSAMTERPHSLAGYSTSDNHSTNVYMNGIKIGSDMLNKPLSEVLSVLPIYCN